MQRSSTIRLDTSRPDAIAVGIPVPGWVLAPTSLERYDEVRAVLEESVALNSSVGDRWGLGSAYRGLGSVAQVRGEHQEAAAMFAKSLDTFTELGANSWVARVLAATGRSFFGLGSDVEARRLCCESLRIAADIHATPIMLDAPASFACLHPDADGRLRALELLRIILNHPATLQETRNRAGRTQSELESQLASTERNAIRANTGGKSFETVVEELLK